MGTDKDVNRRKTEGTEMEIPSIAPVESHLVLTVNL